MVATLERRPDVQELPIPQQPIPQAKPSPWVEWSVLPLVVSGGKAVGVSGWQEAHAAALYGPEAMGTIGGTGLAIVVARELQEGDKDSYLRKAFAAFPNKAMAKRVWREWFIKGGKKEDQPYKSIPMMNFHPSKKIKELTILANFTTVKLAKEGLEEGKHGKIAINYLTKVEPPHLYEIYGAMLAGVDAIVMGAGIPKQIPQMLNNYADYKEASYALDVKGAKAGEFKMRLDPCKFVPTRLVGRKLKRPRFLTIVARHELAEFMEKEKREPDKGVDGYIVAYSGINAGHSAPPRKEKDKTAAEPTYTPENDYADLQVMRGLGKPFWLAGGQADPDKLIEALDKGAAGIQVGSITAASKESNIKEGFKQSVRRLGYNNQLKVATDRRISPTGFYFNWAFVPDAFSEALSRLRERICDLGYLRELYKREDGSLGYRCPADVVSTYVQSGGKEADTKDRACICNHLTATIGKAQIRLIDGEWVEEKALVTFCNAPEITSKFFHALMRNENDTYTVANAFDYLLGRKVHT